MGEVCKACGRPFVRPRSNKANDRYWAILQQAALSTGYTAEELHEIAKAKFARSTKPVFGEIQEYVRTTTLMNAQEFSDYVNRVELWLMEHGIITSQ